jgi:hypothetical protein
MGVELDLNSGRAFDFACLAMKQLAGVVFILAAAILG